MSPVVVSRQRRRRWILGGLVVGLAIAALGIASAFGNSSPAPAVAAAPTTPIKHVVVMFQENESFDHYFGTYPNATNPSGEPAFTAAAGTPSVNGLTQPLLEANPNGSNPRRLDRTEAVTCDMDHGYADEQKAYDHGLMDKFVEFTAGGGCADRSMVMDYFDGNTVTGLWNLAQHFALSDNSFSTQFGPSTPGALNLISGETHGAEPSSLSGSVENGTVMGDPEPAFDDCGNPGVAMTGKNVGDLLNEKEVTWGWFQGGFAPTEFQGTKAVCGATHVNVANASVVDYSPHHDPFEYYQSTSNRHHRLPESEAMIGISEPGQPEGGANHLYDMSAFDEAVKHENLPAVSFLKAPEYEDGHPGYSDPLDEQAYLAEKLDELENSNEWESTAVIIAYDDSDGWYDHVLPPNVTPSKSASDFLSGAGECGHVTDESAAMDHCGYGPRQPLLVISPYAKQNYVAETVSDQTSILKFIEENWGLGRIGSTSLDNKAESLEDMFDFAAGAPKAPKVFLSPQTGEVTSISGGEGAGSGEAPGSGSGEMPSSGGSGTTSTGSTSSWTSTGSNSPTPAPTPRPKAKAKPRPQLKCAVDGTGKRVQIACTVKGGSGSGAVRFRLYRGHSLLGTARATIHADRAAATVAVKRPPSGQYRLVATVDRDGGVTALEHTVSLPGKSSAAPN